MAQYTRTTAIDSGPTGDSVKQAVLDVDTDLTGVVAAYNAHDTATTSVHGCTGAATGTGAMVRATTPTLVTPVLGVATATSINKVALTAPATSATLTIADGASLITSGAFSITLTATATTSVTLPTSGTLVSSVTTGNGVSASNTAGALAFTLGVITPTSVNGLTLTAATTGFTIAGGTTSKTLTVTESITLNTVALNGVLYGSSLNAIGSTAIGAEGQILRAGASPFVPAWTTATFPATTTINQILYSSAANTVTGLATGNSSVLVTNGSGVPSLATDIPTAVTIGTKYVYRAEGTDIPVTDGGTGVSTLTTAYGLLAAGTTATGNVQTIAAGLTTQILVGGGASALPAWGTDLPTAVTIGSAYIYRAAGTDVPVTDGGTGVSTLTTAYGLLAAGTTATGNVQTLAAGLTTQILVGGGASALPAWGTDIPTAVTIGSAYIYRAGGTDVAVADGGTNISSYAVGDILYASGTTTLSKLADVAVGSVLASGGVTTAPAWSSTPTLSTLTLSTAITDNTATTQAATTAYAKSQDAVLAREPDQGVAMTYAASGSSGITVADNDNIDFGTGNFTLVWKGSLPDWTSAADPALLAKYGGGAGYYLYVSSSGSIRALISGTSYIGNANTFVDGSVHEIAAVVSVGAVNTTVDLYTDGVAFGTQLSAANPGTVSSAATLRIMGDDSTSRTAGTVHHAYTFNRALTAAEVLDLYRNGISEADKWGSQTSIITGNDSTFAGASNWVNVNLAVYDETTDGVLTITASGANQFCRIPAVNVPMTADKKYRLTFSVASLVSTWYIMDAAAAVLFYNPINADGSYSVEFTNTTSAGGLSIVAASTTSSGVFDNFLLYEIGATLALTPEGIQPAPGQWLDSSSNKLHAMQPAAGSNLTRYKKDFEYRWTNTWTASSAAQYVGGLNQAVLSADHFITDVITQATETTDVENLTLGDGSAADKFVAAFTPSATRTKQTVAAQNDGTNLKLVYTPAAEATMTVETIIRGFIWEP